MTLSVPPVTPAPLPGLNEGDGIRFVGGAMEQILQMLCHAPVMRFQTLNTGGSPLSFRHNQFFNDGLAATSGGTEESGKGVMIRPTPTPSAPLSPAYAMAPSASRKARRPTCTLP